MDELTIAFFTIVPLAILAIVIWLYYFFKKREQEEDKLMDMVASEETEKKQKQKAVKPDLVADKRKFWNIESDKATKRKSVLKIFEKKPKEQPKPKEKTKDKPKAKPKIKPILGLPKVQKSQSKQPIAIEKASFKSKNYKLRHLKNLTRYSGDIKNIKEHLLKIKDVHKSTPMSKLRKMSKKGSREFLDALKTLNKKPTEPDKPKEPKKDSDSINKLASLPDKRTKIINKLRKLHR